MNRTVCALASAMLFAGLAAEAGAQPRSIYQQTAYKGQEIGRLTGDVYYARMDDYLSVFMVTPDGIVLVEPIGTEFATWLKGELATRFKMPVKYVIYSHHHWDHGSGAAVFADVHAEARTKVAEHLYTVAFEGAELWGDRAEPNTEIRIELFEPYLEPA